MLFPQVDDSNQLMSPPPIDPESPDRSDVAIAERRSRSSLQTKPPNRFRVLLHNDDFTTMEFVVWVLEHFFLHPVLRAQALMLQVHTQGVAIAGVYAREVAESKVAEVSRAAEQHGMPLRVTAEPEA